jgi:beta-glucanase (GH16 family)
MLNALLNIRYAFLKSIGLLSKTDYYDYKVKSDIENYQNFYTIQDKELKRLTELETIINSDDFKTKKKDKAFAKGEGAELISEFKKLKKSDAIKFYNKYSAKKKFEYFDRLNTLIDDEFDSGKLDNKSWSTTKNFGKEKLVKDYSYQNEQDIKTEKNISFEDSLLSITTKEEKIEGKVWTSKLGFVMKERSYSSSSINTQSKIELQYGVVKVKFKSNTSSGILNSISLKSDDNKDYISVCNNSDNKISLGTYSRKGIGKVRKSTSKIKLDSSQDFYVYEVIWTPSKIEWKLNGLTVRVEKNNIPSKKMYLELSSSVPQSAVTNALPSDMQIDWIKTYEYKD